jgi:hypothetical protein
MGKLQTQFRDEPNLAEIGPELAALAGISLNYAIMRELNSGIFRLLWFRVV